MESSFDLLGQCQCHGLYMLVRMVSEVNMLRFYKILSSALVRIAFVSYGRPINIEVEGGAHF